MYKFSSRCLNEKSTVIIMPRVREVHTLAKKSWAWKHTQQESLRVEKNITNFRFLRKETAARTRIVLLRDVTRLTE